MKSYKKLQENKSPSGALIARVARNNHEYKVKYAPQEIPEKNKKGYRHNIIIQK